MEKSIVAAEAATMLGMDKRTLYRWIQMGTCPFGAYIKDDMTTRGFYYVNRVRLEAYMTGRDMHHVCPRETDTEVKQEPLEDISVYWSRRSSRRKKKPKHSL